MITNDSVKEDLNNDDFKEQLDLCELDRWNSSVESPGLMMNPSGPQDQDSARKNDNNKLLINYNYLRQKPRDALDLEWQEHSPITKPITSNAETLTNR